MIIKLVLVALLTVLINVIVKSFNQQFATLVSICGGMICVMLCVDGFTSIISSITSLSSSVASNITEPLVKVLSIGYITEFSADIAEDSGNKSICSKILFGGKIAICVVSLPIIQSMLSAILSLL